MRKCDEECPAICDFCKHYNYNGEDLTQDGIVYKNAVYTYNGFCTLHCQRKEPYDECSDFYCSTIDKPDDA